MKIIKNCLLGFYLLLQSPSGIFSLICLSIMTILTWRVPVFGAAPWVAFFGIVPAILCYAEHKETMQQIVQSTFSSAPPPPPPAPLTPPIPSVDLPPNGQV